MISLGQSGRKRGCGPLDLAFGRVALARCTGSAIILLALLIGCYDSAFGLSTDLNEHKQIHRYTDSSGDIIAIKEGADLDLSCPINVPDEDMIISWTCEDEPANIRSSRIHVTESGKLRIHSAKLGDSCNYRCEAANGFGTLSVVIRVIIVERRLIDRMTRRPFTYEPSTSSNHDIRNQLQLKNINIGPPMMGKSLSEQRDPEVRDDTARSDVIISDSDIDIQIEPSKVSVSKNLTFSLECRIKYARHVTAPQIIWLKEYMGKRPASLPDALEQSLILLDDVYYHWLNWPSSITRSEKSLSASSALLIRQSNYVHSGRYVCLAGYPAAIMSLQHNQLGSTDLTSQDEALTTSRADHARSVLKYKIAHALVQVDDEEGRLKYQNLVRPSESLSLLSNSILTNSWIRNLTILLCLLISIVTIYKLIQCTKRRKNSKPTAIGNSTSGGSNRALPRGGQGCNACVTGAESQGDMPLSRHGNTLSESGYKIDEKLLGRKLMVLNDRGDIESSTDHVYSEIGFNNEIKPKKMNEPYYKVPKTNLSNGICEG